MTDGQRIEAARNKADWRATEQLYEQFVQIVKDPNSNHLPSDVPGALAEALGRLFAHYDALEEEFADALFAFWSEHDQLKGSSKDRFRKLYFEDRLDKFREYKPIGSERRRPKPFEASVETVRRLRDVNSVRDSLASTTIGGILGGSLSYGRFFNVAGASASGKASDTDLLIIIPDYSFLEGITNKLEEVNGVSKDSVIEFRRRCSNFVSIRRDWKPCIISHKVRMWEDGRDAYLAKFGLPPEYLLSLHIFSEEDFMSLILKDMPILEPQDSSSFERYVYDYRDTEPTRSDNLRSFSGLEYSIPLQKTKVAQGYVNRVAVCQIRDERYCPGLHQNLILPQFEIRWQSPSRGLYLPVLGFRWKILERLREERRLRPFEIQNLVLSHTRNAVFSPHIDRRAKRE